MSGDKVGTTFSCRAVEIVTVDDHPMTRLALKIVLEQRPGWRVTHEFQAPSELIAALRQIKPTIIIADLLFHDESGLDLLEHLKAFYPQIRLLVYSMRNEAHYARRCLRAGARGYVAKEQPIGAVVEAIDRLLAGGRYLCDGAADGLREELPRSPSGPLVGDERISLLSNRELEVFQYIGQGMNTRQIAQAVCRSVKTVETYRHRIKKKLGVGTAVELAQYAYIHREGSRVEAS